MEMYLGFDIGGTKCAAVLGTVTQQGMQFLGRREIATFACPTPQQTIEQLFLQAEELLAQAGGTVKAAGVSCGSPLDAQKGLILSPPNLYGWDHVEICAMIRQRFKIPAFLENDANACALAEWKFGAGRGTQSMVFLTFGTGMGAGLILDGRLYRGASGGAGEVGHVRLDGNGPVGYGKRGSFEGFCSGSGIAQLGRTLVLEQLQQGNPPAFCPDMESLGALTAKKIALAAQNGDELAKKIYRVCGEYLGRGLSMIMDVLNPEMIVLGSIYQRSSGLLQEAMEKVIDREALMYTRRVCRVVPAVLGDSIGDYAALAVAVNGMAAGNAG